MVHNSKYKALRFIAKHKVQILTIKYKVPRLVLKCKTQRLVSKVKLILENKGENRMECVFY